MPYKNNTVGFPWHNPCIIMVYQHTAGHLCVQFSHLLNSIVLLSIHSYRCSNLYGTSQLRKKRQQGKKDQRPRSNYLRSIAEFQPHEPRRLIKILRPPSLLCTSKLRRSCEVPYRLLKVTPAHEHSLLIQAYMHCV